MTLLISWIGVDDNRDGKKPASLYIASDSRFSWSDSERYESGVKTFGCSNFPEIFGFCGDVLLPTILLNGLVSQIDAGLLFNIEHSAKEKRDIIENTIKKSLNSYPKDKTTGQFTILYGTRIETKFHCYEFRFNIKDGFHAKELILPNQSTIIFSGGSGSPEFDANFVSYKGNKENNSRTSRGVYHCLTKTLYEIKDKRTGNIPQILGLYRNSNRKLYGIISRGKRYINGFEAKSNINLEGIEWRNENFERVNPQNLKLLDGAQRQPF